MDSTTLNKQLFDFLSHSPTPFHAVDSMTALLDKAGFKGLDEREQWNLSRNQPYYVVREDGALVAFNLGKEDSNGFRIIGSHSDSPCLQVKPKPDIYEKSYHQIGVEVYGGALLHPWFDRELSIAGRLAYRSEDSSIHTTLIDLARPVAVIPSVAIHLDRKANNEHTIDAQKDIVPLTGLSATTKTSLAEILQSHLHETGIQPSPQEILSSDLYFYDCRAPCHAGFNNDFILAGRLDNLLSCFVITLAMTAAPPAHNFMFVCNNHEEVGSATASGAHGNLLDVIFERLYPEPAPRYRTMANSFFISVDNAHAVHPNFPEKHEPCHDILLNHGPVLKINAAQKYSSTGVSNAIFKMLCHETGTPVQEFVMRNDMACGSTIGPVTSSKIGVAAVDIGAASLGMHSIREVTGSQDPLLMYTVISHFLTRDTLPTVTPACDVESA